MKEDFNRLRLKHHGDPAMMEEILQRECRYKTSSKLPETLKCEDFRFPSLAVAEMSTSDAVASVHAAMVPDGSRVLDMTCGLGIDAFRFARKCADVTTVELDHHTALTARHNAEALGLTNVSIVEGESIEFLERTDGMFDVIFVDPARRNASGRHFLLKDCSPDIIPHLPLILSHCRTLIIKASPMIDITAAVGELGYDCEVKVIGTAKECKEVVFKIDSYASPSTKPSVLGIEAVTVGHTGFSYIPADETAESIPPYASPVAGGCLYEPYPAVMKAGGMKILSRRYGVARLHGNTNLFTSPFRVSSFPGAVFEILDVLPFSKQTVRTIGQKYQTINVATRNFPLTAPQLSAKLKTKDGGDRMLFGTTAPDGSKILVITTMGKNL
ncbi:MAG: class I SAM-dependent methyltransferase [Duncaniella sp.]|nr:class I SAM-dependent methyltransferase [Duncaniella sp.]